MIFCIQCAMKAMVEKRPPPKFDQTMAEHMREYHPDPAATRRERIELEEKLEAMQVSINDPYS